MMDHTQLQKKTQQYVTKLFEENSKEDLVYHNLDHTKFVVEKTMNIAQHYRLNEEELLILHTAAWFHDTGYLFVRWNEHEQRSVELMKAFAAQLKMDESTIAKIEGCIMATRVPRNPQNLLEQVICDADTFNFGTKDFKKTNKQVFQEMNFYGEKISKATYSEQAYKLLTEHEFYTSYCKELLDKGKEKNIKKLKKKIPAAVVEEELKLNEKLGTTKGMQTMLRLTSANHIKLSDMADSKANILISVNAIIISVILSILLRKLQSDPYLTIPTIIFLTVSVITIVIAIIATRPKISSGMFEDNDILTKKTNLLFFGNFYKVDVETYEKAMRNMMSDSDYLYSSIIKDIYFLGVVLSKKYKLLRLAYNIFMVGIVISVVAFAIASFFLHQQAPQTVPGSNTNGSPF